MTGETAMDVPFKYLVSDTDRHSNKRYYVRVPGRNKVRIRAAFGSADFRSEYDAAMDGAPDGKASAVKEGSFRHLCVRYFGGDKFRALDPSTQGWQRRTLEEISEKYGQNPVARMESRHVRKIRNEKTRAVANMRMKAMRAMFNWANEEEECFNNPTLGVKNVKYQEVGHHAWTEEEIEQYYKRHLPGTMARIAADLIRGTTGRREDIPRFGRQHFKDGRIKYRQGKNDKRNPVDIDMPCHPSLAASIEAFEDAHPDAKKRMTYLATEFGKAFTTNGFGNKFKDWCRQADLPHCSAHGIRKFTSAQLAENEATAHEIGAITGHQTLEEIERYTKSARKKKLADTGVAKLKW